jgi:tetratricopeptide (TPR) repeat protein
MPVTLEFDRAMHAAIAAARRGDLADARAILERVAQSAPVNDGFFMLYLDVLEAQRDWRAVATAARAWQKLRPDGARALEAQARAAAESGLLYEALDLYGRSIELGGRDANRLATFGRLCLNALEFDRAARALEEAEALDPENVHMLAAKASLLTFRGRFDEAAAYCRRSLARDPSDVVSYRLLGQLQDGRLSSEERAALARLAVRSGLRVENRILAAFALGDSLDAEGDIDGAFAAYEQAQRLAQERGRAESLVYQPEHAARDTDALLSRFASIPIGPHPSVAGLKAPRPLFIVGMPRSGTTLVECVLGAHSRVRACGERMGMRQIKREYLRLVAELRPVTEETWTNFQRAYLDRLPELGAADHITDKNPWNFDAVGLILALLPDAHVIHVRRNPVETGLSIYSHPLPKFQSFAQRLEHIGHYYGQYARLMRHWEQLAGDRMTTIQYEDFAADFDRAAPALLDACGLGWEEDCRNFQHSERVIATLSAMQVRRPVKRAAGRARRYERHLRPLVEALQSAGVDLATGAAGS